MLFGSIFYVHFFVSVIASLRFRVGNCAIAYVSSILIPFIVIGDFRCCSRFVCMQANTRFVYCHWEIFVRLWMLSIGAHSHTMAYHFHRIKMSFYRTTRSIFLFVDQTPDFIDYYFSLSPPYFTFEASNLQRFDKRRKCCCAQTHTRIFNNPDVGRLSRLQFHPIHWFFIATLILANGR